MTQNENTTNQQARTEPVGSVSETPEPDVSLQDAIDAVTDLIEAKQLQWSSQWELVKAETRLLRQSILVTVLATLATFTFAFCCWLLINAGIAILLANGAVSTLVIALILVMLNAALLTISWRVAKGAFKHITLQPLLNAAKGQPHHPEAKVNQEGET